MTSEWADELVRERRAKQEQRRTEDEARITDRKRIQNNAEPIWQNIRSLVYKFAEQLNEAANSHEVTVENSTPNEVKVAVDDHVATLKFIPRDQKLHVSFYGAELNLAVNRHDKLVWQSSAESIKYWTDEEVAKRTVEYAWRPGNPSKA